MFKASHSPLNANKDNKYINSNYNQGQVPDYQPQSYHQSNYQYSKAMYNNNVSNNGYQNQRVQPTNGGNTYGNNAPLCPLSPNVSKNPPTSPNAKIKMFSNTLNVNRKNSSQASNLYHQPTSQNTHQPKQNNKFSRIGAKNLILDLTQSMDLKCDETFDQPVNNNYRKQHPQTCNTNNSKQQNYTKRVASSKIPVLNFQAEVDDLKCDEVLDVKTMELQEESNKGNVKFNNSLVNNNVDSNFAYTNGNNGNNSNNNNSKNTMGDKAISLVQAPLTPGYDKRKANSILMRKNTDRQIYLNNTSSNPSPQNILPTQQKSRSFNNILSPYNPHKKSPQNNQQEMIDNSQFNQSEIQVSQSQQQQHVDQLKRNLQRMSSVLEAYMRKCDDMKERQVLLEKENDQLRRCLYEDAGSKGVQLNQTHNVTSACRYQGIK